MVGEKPKVSIITPTYNRAGFIGEAVESVLAQAMPDWELLIVDDGSTDNTREVLEPYLLDHRIHYIYQSNQGQSGARNTALNRVQGGLVGFLDSDDLWGAHKLERQLSVFQDHAHVHIVHGDESIIDEHGLEISQKNMRRYSGRITPQLLADNSVSITTALVKRECFEEMGGFDASCGVADDYDLWLRFSARYRFYYAPGIVAAYRVMADQISSDKNRRFRANKEIIDDFFKSYPEALNWYEKRSGLSRFLVRRSRYEMAVGKRKKSLLSILEAAKNDPLWAGPWRALAKLVLKSG